MLVLLVLVNLLLCRAVTESDDGSSDENDFGDNLVSALRNDVNLDLPKDEEYEDLRAELLAYHTALASLTSQNRRSMMSTPCWELGGICVEYKLCTGFRFLTEVPGCKDKLNVCCFTWNQFKVSDFRHEGIPNLAMPWNVMHKEFGGLGILDIVPEENFKEKKKKNKKKKMSLNSTGLKVPQPKHLEDAELVEPTKSMEASDPPAVVLLLKSNK